MVIAGSYCSCNEQRTLCDNDFLWYNTHLFIFIAPRNITALF